MVRYAYDFGSQGGFYALFGMSRRKNTVAPSLIAPFLLPGENGVFGCIDHAEPVDRRKIGGCAFHASFKIKSSGGILE